MRIGIDAHVVGTQRGGVETYVSSLVESLARTDADNEYVVYVDSPAAFAGSRLPPNFRRRRLPVSNVWLQRALLLPLMSLIDRLDVVYVQRVLPILWRGRSILHLHDAIYSTHPHLFPPWRRAILNTLMGRSARRATRVLTDSEASKADLVRYYRVDPATIEVLSAGVDRTAFHPIDDGDRIGRATAAFGIHGRYAIYLGAIERTKGIDTLIDAYDRLRRARPDVSLVIVGSWRQETQGGYREAILESIVRLDCRDRVTFTGYVSEDDRLLLLNGASMLVFPSMAEGFGLPPLEAMACGVPVVAASCPAVAEVCSGAARLVPPSDAGALADAMLAVLEEPAVTAELMRRGFERVAHYDWDRIAVRFTDVARTVVTGIPQ